MTDVPEVTLSADRTVTAVETPVATLFIALEGARPHAGSARFALRDVDVVTIGRGAARTATRTHAGGRTTLALQLPDPLMSTRHATLTRELGRWVLADAGSKNGTFIDGAAVPRAPLRDGAMFEVGHTVFVLERRLPAGDLDTSALADHAPGLATLIPELAYELDQLRAVAAAAVPILVGGETGCGKELIARAAHALSGRTGSLVAVNCGALAPTLVESELFGVRRGAFSGAVEDRLGLVRQADRGTLFLDEIGDLAPASQAAFLRVLQEREVIPVGATRPIAVDFRLVAATLRDLEELVAAGAFRADLYARLAGFHVELPPLRERRGDLGLLIASLLRRLAPARTVRFTLDAVRALTRYAWPANIRELERALETALALAPGDTLDAAHLPASLRAPVAPVGTAAPALTEAQRAHRDELLELMRRHAGNVSAVARHLGKARMQIQRWLARYEIDPERFRG